MLNKLKSNFFNKSQHQYDNNSNHIATTLPSISLIIILFTGLFATILISTFSVAFVYSFSNSVTNNTAKTDFINQSSIIPPFKELPGKVKEFILNDIVNKSKAAIVVGFIDPNGTKVYSFGNISKAK